MKQKIIKLILKPVMLMRRIYWKLFRPLTTGVRAIAVKDNEILLVKHNYGNEWLLPGGKMRKGEHFLDALQRELSEEIGLTSFESVKLLGIYANFYEGKSDYISVFVISNFTLIENKHFEIDKIKFFKLDELPDKTSPGTRRRIKEFLETSKLNYKW